MKQPPWTQTWQSFFTSPGPLTSTLITWEKPTSILLNYLRSVLGLFVTVPAPSLIKPCWAELAQFKKYTLSHYNMRNRPLGLKRKSSIEPNTWRKLVQNKITAVSMDFFCLYLYESESEKKCHSVVSNSLWPHGL